MALCAGNSPVTGEFPSQRPVTRSYDVFFDLSLNKRFSKQSCEFEFWVWVWLRDASCYRIGILPSRYTIIIIHMMTSSNGNIFRVTGRLCGEITGQRWIPRSKASNAGLWCFLWSAPWINGWVNNHETGDLRRQRTHYDVIVMHINSMQIHSAASTFYKSLNKSSFCSP